MILICDDGILVGNSARVGCALIALVSGIDIEFNHKGAGTHRLPGIAGIAAGEEKGRPCT